MTDYAPTDPGYADRVRVSFGDQQFMTTLGAELVRVGPGEVSISMRHRADLTQQHGFIHAGAVAAVLDSACGYAAFSLMPADTGVLTVDYTIHLMAPARGEVLTAVARVIRRGRTITVCRAEALTAGEGGETTVAAMQATVMAIRHRPEVIG